MGLFDSVYAGCPRCGAKVEFQSKADEEPYMNTYTPETAPTHILIDVLNSPEYCHKCGVWLAIIAPEYPPNEPPPRPTPTVVPLREPSDDEVKISTSWRWWQAPFSYDDIASAMSAGTAETGTGSGLQPASAAPQGETPTPSPTRHQEGTENDKRFGSAAQGRRQVGHAGRVGRIGRHL